MKNHTNITPTFPENPTTIRSKLMKLFSKNRSVIQDYSWYHLMLWYLFIYFMIYICFYSVWYCVQSVRYLMLLQSQKPFSLFQDERGCSEILIKVFGDNIQSPLWFHYTTDLYLWAPVFLHNKSLSDQFKAMYWCWMKVLHHISVILCVEVLLCQMYFKSVWFHELVSITKNIYLK